MRFPLGRIVATRGALRALQEAGQAPTEFLDRHVNGDWGELDDEDNPTASLVTQGTNLSSQGAISPTYLRHFQWPKEACKQHIRGDFTEVSL